MPLEVVGSDLGLCCFSNRSVQVSAVEVWPDFFLLISTVKMQVLQKAEQWLAFYFYKLEVKYPYLLDFEKYSRFTIIQAYLQQMPNLGFVHQELSMVLSDFETLCSTCGSDY